MSVSQSPWLKAEDGQTPLVPRQKRQAQQRIAASYPLILSGLYRVFGSYETETGRIAQQYFALATALLLLVLLPATARKLGFPLATGWFAAFLLAWLPAHRWNQITGHHEQGFSALALLGVLWICADLRQTGWCVRGRIISLGISLGLTALLCPNLLLVPMLFFFVELVRRYGERRQILRNGLIAATIGFVCVLPWMIRNYVVLSGFVPIRSNFGLELAVGNRPGRMAILILLLSAMSTLSATRRKPADLRN